MKAGVEFIGFASVSLVAHLAVFAATAPEGAESGGSDGAQEMTITAPLGAADADLAALVRQWDKPVQIQQPEDPTALPPRSDPAPQMPIAPDAASSLRQAVPLPRLPDAEGMPQISAEVPALFDRPQTRDTPRPRARPEPKRAAPPAARASGQANQAQSGSGRAVQQSGSSTDANALAQWGGSIRAAIQRRQVDPGTRARGTVHLRLQVSADGRLVSVGVAQSSGNTVLDQAASRAVQRASLPRAPSGIVGTHHFNLPLSYR